MSFLNCDDKERKSVVAFSMFAVIFALPLVGGGIAFFLALRLGVMAAFLSGVFAACLIFGTCVLTAAFIFMFLAAIDEREVRVKAMCDVPAMAHTDTPAKKAKSNAI